MKAKHVFYGIVLCLAICFNSCVRQNDFPVLKGPYLGQEPPGMAPEIFAPGIISTGNFECMAFFSPDGREFYHMLWGPPHDVILFTKEENNRWIEPQVIPFSGQYNGKFSLSPDSLKFLTLYI